MRQLINLIVPIALVIGLAYMARGQMELHERLSALDAHLVRVDARLGSTAETRVVYRPAPTTQSAQATIAATADLTKPQSDDDRTAEESSDATVPVPLIATQMTDRGYMYASDWSDMEPRLATMSVAENKKFWQEMFDALGSGALEVYDE